MDVITVVTGVEVVGDGYDLIYLNDKLVTTGDGNYEYTDGFTAGLQVALPADTVTNVVNLDAEEEVYDWYSALDKSSLKGLLQHAKLNPSISIS